MFTYKTIINFYDCDPAGILFYGRIYNLCHSAYEDMIRSFNLSADYWVNDDFVVPIIHSEASYHKPLKHTDEVIIEIKVKQLRASSFELEYECKNNSGEKCVVVKTVHVFLDKIIWKKKEMDKEVFEGFNQHLE